MRIVKGYFPKINTSYGSVNMCLDCKRFDESFAKAQEYLGDQVLTDCTPLVPKLNMALANSGKVLDGGALVEWDTPYARYQYYGMKMIGHAPKQLTDIPLVQHTAGTVPFWFEQEKSANLEKWVSEVKRIAGDKHG